MLFWEGSCPPFRIHLVCFFNNVSSRSFGEKLGCPYEKKKKLCKYFWDDFFLFFCCCLFCSTDIISQTSRNQQSQNSGGKASCVSEEGWCPSCFHRFLCWFGTGNNSFSLLVSLIMCWGSFCLPNRAKYIDKLSLLCLSRVTVEDQVTRAPLESLHIPLGLTASPQCSAAPKIFLTISSLGWWVQLYFKGIIGLPATLCFFARRKKGICTPNERGWARTCVFAKKDLCATFVQLLQCKY